MIDEIQSGSSGDNFDTEVYNVDGTRFDLTAAAAVYVVGTDPNGRKAWKATGVKHTTGTFPDTIRVVTTMPAAATAAHFNLIGPWKTEGFIDWGGGAVTPCAVRVVKCLESLPFP